MILHHVHDNSISWLNVTFLFPVFPHYDSDLRREQSLIEVGTIVPKSTAPNYINEGRG